MEEDGSDGTRSISEEDHKNVNGSNTNNYRE